MNPHNQKTLLDRSVSALKWNYAGTSTVAISALLINIILARLLGPEPFGLTAIAWLVIGLGNLFADFGMGPALVQRETISPNEIRSAFTMQLCIGIGLTTTVLLCAPMIANIFKQPNAIPVVRAMSFIFVFQTLGSIAVSLLTRELDVKTLEVARMCCNLFSFFVLAIPMAWLGFGVWSLVTAYLSQTTLLSIICYSRVRYPVKPLWIPSRNDLSRFGFKVIKTSLVNYTITKLDSFLVGHFFGVVTLGLYDRAYSVVNPPTNSLVVTTQRVLFPAYSRMQNNRENVRRVYLASLGFMAMLTFPVFGCVALIPATLIDGLFGEQWEAAIPFLVPLALAMPFHAMMATGGPMLWAQDQVNREFVTQLFTACFFVVVLLVTSQISVTMMAWGVLAGYIFRFAFMTHTSFKSLSVCWSTLARLISSNLVVLIITGSVVFGLDSTLNYFHISSLVRLALVTLAGGGIFAAIALFIPRLVFSPEMSWLLGLLTGYLPISIHPIARRISRSGELPVSS